ncbi:short chain dehydrogenase, putative [Leishmania donovani]|uniref:Short chain dehydrogenase, putative n=1 Tax=Leishmania donovani TaxID=5661 RepID=A0A3Q8IBK9_LEIDO|nr:short chain dehydrogenase, putative [Leishmania donovani]
MWHLHDILCRVSWTWEFFLFLLRGVFIAIADHYIMYIRTGRVWLGKRNRAASLMRGDLVMQLAASSPRHSTANEKTIFLQLNRSFIDRRLWAGLNEVGAGPSAIVTGVSYGGIGFYTALNLLLSGVNVHGVARNGRQAERSRYLLASAVDRQLLLHKEWNGQVGRMFVHACDMSDTAAVCNFSDAVAADPALRIIICNAGPMCSPPRLSQQHLEEQFATHHVGHSLLMLRLLQCRLQSSRSQSMAVALPPPWRMVVLTSAAAATANPTAASTFHEWSSQEELEHCFSRFDGYGNAKMSELLFAFSLARFVERHRILAATCTVNVLHPGPIRSRIIPNSQLPLQWLLDGEAAALLRMTPVIASMYVVDLALSRRHEHSNGHFFRMGQDQTIYYRDMVNNARQRSGFKNSTLFPGIPGPAVSLSHAKQQWMWTETVDYFATKELIDGRLFSLS